MPSGNLRVGAKAPSFHYVFESGDKISLKDLLFKSFDKLKFIISAPNF